MIKQEGSNKMEPI